MWSIRQTDTGWEVVHDGEVFGDSCATYDQALAVIAEQVREFLAAADTADTNNPDDGLLPDVWEDAGGIAFSEAIEDGRDFTNCQWTWRDPNASTLPLMLQTETEIGHFGAELAGFIETIDVTSGTVHASGRFYATDMGRQARDLLLSRQFGVSVDPGAVEVDFICTEEDEDGWCVDGTMNFLAYQIIGLTMTPFPGFAQAAIQLRGAASGDSAAAASVERPAAAELADNGTRAQVDALAAAAAARIEVPVRPNRAWFEIPEPQPGMSGMLDVYGMPAEELLVEQRDGGLAVPLTILDDGRVFGHAARWGQRHVGYLQTSVTPPESHTAYAHFHVGSVHTDDGGRLAAGTAVYGCEHAPLRAADGSIVPAGRVRDYYAHSGAGWCQLRVSDGEYGPWASGALLPGLSELQLRILRSLTLSGDWRDLGDGLELIGVLAVNVPGFPIAREALAASGMDATPIARTQATMRNREAVALVAAGTVTRCPRCQERAALAASGGMPVQHNTSNDDVLARLDRIEAAVTATERRTRHLRVAERDAIAARIRSGA